MSFLGETKVSDFCKLFIFLFGGGRQSLKASSLNVLDRATPTLEGGAALKGSVAHEAEDPNGSLNGSSAAEADVLANGSSTLLNVLDPATPTLEGGAALKGSVGFPKGSSTCLLNGSSLLFFRRFLAENGSKESSKVF